MRHNNLNELFMSQNQSVSPLMIWRSRTKNNACRLLVSGYNVLQYTVVQKLSASHAAFAGQQLKPGGLPKGKSCFGNGVVDCRKLQVVRVETKDVVASYLIFSLVVDHLL